MEESLTMLAWVVYGIIAVSALIFPGTFKVNDVPVRNPLARVVAVIVLLPIIGGMFFLMGLVGQFLLLPIKSLF